SAGCTPFGSDLLTINPALARQGDGIGQRMTPLRGKAGVGCASPGSLDVPSGKLDASIHEIGSVRHGSQVEREKQIGGVPPLGGRLLSAKDKAGVGPVGCSLRGGKGSDELEIGGGGPARSGGICPAGFFCFEIHFGAGEL